MKILDRSDREIARGRRVSANPIVLQPSKDVLFKVHHKKSFKREYLENYKAVQAPKRIGDTSRIYL
jgi:hypothetical protein